MRSPATFVIICLLRLIHAESEETEFKKDLHKLTNEIVSEYFKEFKCITYITDERHDETSRRIQDRPILLVTLSEDEESDVTLLIETIEQSCGGYVIRVVNGSRLTVVNRLLEAKGRAIANRYPREKYIFLPYDENDRSTEFFKDSDMLYVPNLIMITPAVNPPGNFSLLSHTAFNHYKKEVLGLHEEVLDTWSSRRSFAARSNLYPDKVKNVQGKKFIFGLLHYSPFSLIFNEDNITSYDGYETRVMAEFVRIINGTWDGLDHPKGLWGAILPNGTNYGIVGSVKEKKADFGFGAVYQWYCDKIDCSVPLYQSKIICLVPKPEMISGWFTIFLPFSPFTWLALLIGYIINSTAVFFILASIRRFKGFKISNKMALSDSFFTVMRLQFQQIPRIPKRKEPLGSFIKICVYYYFFVAASWQGGIASILTVPRYEKPIDETADLLERWPKVEWGANSDVWINLIKNSDEPDMIEISKKFLTLDDETLIRRKKTKDFGFFIEKLPNGHYGFNDYINEDGIEYLRAMKGSLYRAFGVIVLPRGSPFSEKLDYTVQWMYDTGLMQKIEVQVSIERINNRLQTMINEYVGNEHRTTSILAIRHIEAAIYIYILGMFLASVTLLVERHLRKSHPYPKKL